MLKLLRYLLPSVILCLCANFVWAHGPAHEYIARLTKKIEKEPENASLYLARGGYFKEDGNFDKSFADYHKARALDPSLVTLDFLLAELFYDFEYYNSAIAAANTFQRQNINTAQCYLLKAKAFDKLFMADSAEYYSEAAYPHLKKYNTSYFVGTKVYVLFANKDNYKRASYWLDEGKKRMPHDLVIQEEYVHLAIKFEDYDKAIALCEEKIGSLKRKEYWYHLLAGAYSKAGNKQAAVQNLKLAESAINKLPRHHKSTSYIINLKKNILILQEQLN